MNDDLPDPLDVTVGDPGDTARDQNRPWLGMLFECCGVYTRIYRNTEESAYVGSCPKCGMPVRLPIGPDGTSSRFFSAS